MGTKIFHIIEARDPETRHVEDRRVYTTEEQYLIRGMKQVEKFNKVYDVKVTKYICEESVEVLNLKVDELQPKEVDVVKLDESDIKRIVKRVLNEVGGYDSSEVMATHAGPLHSIINGKTMELLMLVSELASSIEDEELNKTELTNGIYNLNQKISEYIDHMPDYVKEIYIDDDFKSVLNSFINALIKINKYFRILVGSGQNDLGQFYTGLSFDMSQDELELKVAEQISTLSNNIYELGEMIVKINQRFSERTNSMNE